MADIMSKAGYTTDQIIGFVRIQVIEAKGVAALDTFSKSSDPYARLFYHGFRVPQKTRVIEKNLNPIWNQQFHSWIYESKPCDLDVEVWDKDMVDDDFAGQCTISITPEEGKVVDQWYDLKGRPGKKDKHVKGSIHIRYETRFMQRNASASIWTKPVFIMIDPDTFTRCIEIQGVVDEDLMNIFCAGISIPSPERTYDKDGSPSSWQITVPFTGSAFSMSEPKRVLDRMQNYMIKIWNRWRELGWFYVSKNKDNLLFLNFPSNAPWYAPPPSNTKPIGYPGYITIDERPLFGKLEIQGEIDPAVAKEAAGNFELERVDDKDGTFLRWCITIPVSIGLTGKGVLREEQRFQLAFLNLVQVLGRHGYIYISDYVMVPVYGARPESQHHSFYSSPQDWREKTHIFYRDLSTWYYSTNVCPPNYLLVDPRAFKWKICILGAFEVQMFKEYNPTFPEPKDFKDKDGSHLSWQWKVKKADKIAWTEKQWKRIENRFQNYMLNVFNGLSRMGYKYVVDIGTISLFMRQGPPVPEVKHIMMDIGWFNMAPVMELQGEVDGTLLNEIGAVTGLTAKEVLDEDGSKLCYSSQIPFDMDFVVSSKELRRIENQFQCYLLNAFNVLTKVGYEYVTAQKNLHVWIKRVTPAPALNWVLIDPTYYMNQGYHIELQGTIDSNLLQHIGQLLGQSPKEMINKKSNNSFGWSWSVPDTNYFYMEGTPEAKKMENRIQNTVLRILDALYAAGYITVDRADTERGLFLTRHV